MQSDQCDYLAFWPHLSGGIATQEASCHGGLCDTSIRGKHHILLTVTYITCSRLKPLQQHVCAPSDQSHLQCRHEHAAWSVRCSVHYHFFFPRCVGLRELNAGHDTTAVMAQLRNIKYFIPYITSRAVCHTLWTQFRMGSEVRSHHHDVGSGFNLTTAP